MSNLWINIRIGTRHLQVVRGFKGISFRTNPYHVENPPKTWVEVLDFFGLVT